MPMAAIFGNYVGHLEHRQLIPRPRSAVFGFFSDAANLETLTPKFLKFHILTPRPITMQAGTLIDYELTLMRVRFHWQTLIEQFEPELRFVDIQLRGPYKRWHHEHRFEQADRGTWVIDRVDYEMPLGPLGRVAHALWVARSLQQIFAYRAAKMRELFGV